MKKKPKSGGIAEALRAKAAIALLRTLSWMPVAAARKIGAFTGWAGWVFNSRHARITRINLALCFPELSENERKILGQKSLIESGKTAAEMGAVFLWPVERCLSLIESVENETLLTEAIAEGKGVVVLAPHLGNWELIGPYLAKRGRFVALYQPPREAELDRLLVSARARAGIHLAAANQRGVAGLFRELSGGAITGILPDQQPARKAGGVFAPFFGVSAFTATLLPKILQKTGARVICGVAFRTKTGFKLHFLEADPGLYDADETAAATAVNRDVQKCVRLAPEQYSWEYKRFRRRPAGEQSPY